MPAALWQARQVRHLLALAGDQVQGEDLRCLLAGVARSEVGVHDAVTIRAKLQERVDLGRAATRSRRGEHRQSTRKAGSLLWSATLRRPLPSACIANMPCCSSGTTCVKGEKSSVTSKTTVEPSGLTPSRCNGPTINGIDPVSPFPVQGAKAADRRLTEGNLGNLHRRLIASLYPQGLASRIVDSPLFFVTPANDVSERTDLRFGRCG